MLIEGIDDSVIYLSSVIFVLLGFLMYNYLRKRIFQVEQINPQIHSESRDDINRVREEMQAAAAAAAASTTVNDEEASIEMRLRQRHGSSRNINCPICLANANFPIETNCGHIFCAQCIIQYWQHLTSNLNKMKCPMCRQDVSCLLPLYSRREAAQVQSSDELSRVFASIQSYNRRFSGAPRDYWDYISDIPILLRHVLNEMFSFNDLSIWYRIRFGFLIFLSFIYFISPLDIIPEALFGLFGLLDDILVVLFLVIYICTLYRQIIANRT